MSTDNVLWQSGESIVPHEHVRTRLVTVALNDIDLVEVRRPLLSGATLLCAASIALVARFADVLLTNESIGVLGLGCTAIVLGRNTARLKLHSYSIDGIAITLPIWRAKAMRKAVENALSSRDKSLNRISPQGHGNSVRGKRHAVC